jgi:hypothetical protein
MPQIPDIEGLNKLKEASIWFTIVTLITTIGIFYTTALILAFVIIILVIIKGIPSLRDAFNSFKIAGKNVDRGIQGLSYLLWGYIIFLVLGFFAIFAIIGSLLIHVTDFVVLDIVRSIPSLTYFVALGVIDFIVLLAVAIGLIISFIAYLFIGLVIYGLGTFYASDLMKIGGILIIIPIINFIGWILTYTSIDEIIKKIQGVKTFTPTQPIYQVGNGILRLDGSSSFSLYSPVSGIEINRATIQELNLLASDIQPRILIQGINNISLKFPTLSSVILGRSYNIILTLSTGQVVVVKVDLVGT